MERMLEVLAEKYEVDQTNPAWKSTLFNKLCVIMDIEKAFQEEREDFKKIEKELNDMVSEKMKYEIFLINVCANTNISSVFRNKLKGLAKKAGLKINYELFSNSHRQYKQKKQ